MTKTEAALTEKAKKAGLTLELFQLILELCADVADHANVEALAFERSEVGCMLTLMSMEARYQLQRPTCRVTRIICTFAVEGRFSRIPRCKSKIRRISSIA